MGRVQRGKDILLGKNQGFGGVPRNSKVPQDWGIPGVDKDSKRSLLNMSRGQAPRLNAASAISAAVASWSRDAPDQARRHPPGISQHNEGSHRLPRTRCTD
jgi:hypothetical protein